MKRFALVLTLAACSSSNNPPADVQGRFFTQFAEVQELQAQALQAQTSFAPAPFDGTVDYSGACSGGGSITVSGAYSGDGSSSNATFDQQMTFAGCVVSDTKLDGDWHWSGSVSNGAEEFSITADLDIVAPDYATHFSYDVTMILTADGHFSVEGSMVVGGTHYDADFSYPN